MSGPIWLLLNSRIGSQLFWRQILIFAVGMGSGSFFLRVRIRIHAFCCFVSGRFRVDSQTPGSVRTCCPGSLSSATTRSSWWPSWSTHITAALVTRYPFFSIYFISQSLSFSFDITRYSNCHSEICNAMV